MKPLDEDLEWIESAKGIPLEKIHPSVQICLETILLRLEERSSQVRELLNE